MSTNKNRAKVKNVIDNRTYKLLLLNFTYPIYWDEGITEYPHYRKGFKNPLKRLFKHEIRMYRTWKYNRLTKYK